MSDFRNVKKMLGFMESSDGKNVNHSTMDSGMHEGTSAMGEYGLMPITAKEMAKQGETDLDDLVSKADPRDVEEILKGNPEAYQRYVDKYLTKVTNKAQDPIEAAALWYGGPNQSKTKVKRFIASDQDNYASRAGNAIDEKHLMSGGEPNVYDYITGLKEFEDFKNRSKDKLYNPADLDQSNDKLRLRKK